VGRESGLHKSLVISDLCSVFITFFLLLEVVCQRQPAFRSPTISRSFDVITERGCASTQFVCVAAERAGDLYAKCCGADRPPLVPCGLTLSA